MFETSRQDILYLNNMKISKYIFSKYKYKCYVNICLSVLSVDERKVVL
jgi:hypothetical protein